MDMISKFENGFRNIGYWSSPPQFANQVKIKTREEAIDFINKYNGISNCGISISTFDSENRAKLLYLPFDFDSDIIENAWSDVIRLYRYFKMLNYKVSLRFSGFKGYHCIVEVAPKFYLPHKVKNVQKHYKELLNLTTCDESIFGDLSRLIRLDGTLHCGKFKRIKGKGWIRIGEGSYCEEIDSNDDGFLLDLNKIETKEYFKEKENNKNIVMEDIHSYPCVEKLINGREPPQLIRYSYVARLIRLGEDPDNILQILKDNHSDGKIYEWDDWNEDYTRTQIYHIYNNGSYNPLNCSSLKSMECCLKEECRYYTDDWIKKMKRNNAKKE